MFDVFEQPWTLLIVAIVVLLILLIFRAIFPAKRRWWQFAIPVLIAASAFALDLLVKTDLEKIKDVIYTAAKAVEEENPDAIEPLISANYRDSYHNTKDILLTHCRAKLSEPLIDKNITRILSIEISPSKTTSTAAFTVRIMFDRKGYAYEFKPELWTKIKIDLQKTPDSRWLISRAELLELDHQPANWQDIKQLNW